MSGSEVATQRADTIDGSSARKARGAFFTPPGIADFLCRWAIHANEHAMVLDPTCGEAVFLQAAANCLVEQGRVATELRDQLFGFDIDAPSLARARELLVRDDADATLGLADFFTVAPPGPSAESELPAFDAVVGNPPFIRYQEHHGAARVHSSSAALAQGVRLSGLASSWAAALVHSAAFLRPEGRLAMVLPAELLTVQYAEPVRRWLSQRFARVTIVLMERLQFADTQERTLLLLAQGCGGCETFGLAYVDDESDLARLFIGDDTSVVPNEGKWTELFLTAATRRLHHRICADRFGTLGDYGNVALGTVTGANDFFALSEADRLAWGLAETDVTRICPPGGRHVKGLRFSDADWSALRTAGERVWLFSPTAPSLRAESRLYVEHGEAAGVHEGYKCRMRAPWWRVPLAAPPDLLFTYMSHNYPRIVQNAAGARALNSVHGVWLRSDVPSSVRRHLPLLALNSVSLLGAELNGRSYGGGVLKLEPREAASLPVPRLADLANAAALLSNNRSKLARSLAGGHWTNVVKAVDDALLVRTLSLSPSEVETLHRAAVMLRSRRLGG